MSAIVRGKIDASKLFDCRDITLFASSIRQILPFRGYSNSRFYMCEYFGVRFLTKMTFYRKIPWELYAPRGRRDVIPQPDAEIEILNLLRKHIIEPGASPCILELVTSKVCTKISRLAPRPRECEQLIIDYSITNLPDNIDQLLCKYMDLVKNGFAHDKIAFLVLEKCDMNLDEYIRNSVNSSVGIAVLKSILFMVIHALYAISRVYPGFRHYDLHTDNIVLKFDRAYKFRASEPKFLTFDIDGETYAVPYFGIIPKIIDFGFSVIPEEGIYSNIIEDKYHMFNRADNDALFLFHHVYITISSTGNPLLKTVEKILADLEPNHTYKHYYTEYIRKVDKLLPSYDTMIRSKTFSEYRKYVIDKSQVYAAYVTP
jgi:hypothetical protein